MSRARREMEQARRRIFEKLADSPSLTEQQRQAVKLGYRLGLRENSDLWLAWARQSAREHRWLTALNQLRHAGIERARYYAADAGAVAPGGGLGQRGASLLPGLRYLAAGLGSAFADALTHHNRATLSRRPHGPNAVVPTGQPQPSAPTSDTRAA